ncbi:MAG: insulinase family protein [Ignavibacteriales bacterium]|nr:insulinase family protein [Ignavibacteriales bacterium]
MRKPFAVLIVLFLFVPIVWAQDGFKEVQKQVVEFTLKNGLRFMVLPRHDAPVVSFHTYVDVGAVNESRGITGLAHVFEHLAFKGTKRGRPGETSTTGGRKRTQQGFQN